RTGCAGDRRRRRGHRAEAALANRHRRRHGAVRAQHDGRRDLRGDHARCARPHLVVAHRVSARRPVSSRGMPIDAEIPASALAVYAHPDDPEISAGGTLASWAEAGADVTVLITTRGDKGTQDPDADQEELARLRV